MTTIREAEPADHPRLAESLAAAFHDDPVAAWAIPPEPLREPVLRAFFLEYLRQKQRYGTVWCDDELRGAAIWAPPGKAVMGPADTIALLRRVFRVRLAARGPMLAWGALAVERRQPAGGGFFYLVALGVDPSAQGEGLGSRLMAPVLELCDAEAVPAYLESSKESNVAYYARHGFRSTAAHRLPRGPAVHLMFRGAQE